MSFEIEQFDILAALVKWMAAVGSCVLIGLFVGAVVSFLAYGPRGFRRLWGGVKRGIVDLTRLSGRRITAIASLAIRESLHRKALWVFAVFVPLFMFGGWFLQTDMLADKPAKPFVVFVLTVIRWLLVPVAILLACWGLPADIKDRSLHTVVTKPVRRSEVIIGRMLGYGLVTTLVLLVMSGFGYIFILRTVPDRAKDQLISRVPLYSRGIYFVNDNGERLPEGEIGGKNVGDIWEYRSYIEGQTNARAGWRFEGIDEDSLTLDPDGQRAVAAAEQLAQEPDDHPRSDDEDLVLQMVQKAQRLGYAPENPSPEMQQLLRSLSENGLAATRLPKLSPPALGDLRKMMGELKNLKLEYKFEAFRTHKGTIDEGVRFRLDLVKANGDDTEVRIPWPPTGAGIEIQEFAVGAEEAVILIPRMLSFDVDDDGRPERLDLINDVVRDGRLILEVKCEDSGQFIGVAQPDLFIRKIDRSFAAGYFKSMLATWMMVLLIIIIGTTASCFVKGPVATFLTLGLVIMGGTGLRTFLMDQLDQYYDPNKDVVGGGFLESAYRMVTAMNQTSDLPENSLTSIIKFLDPPIFEGLNVLRHVIPNFNYFNTTKYVANGFDVPWGTIDAALLPAIATTLGYLIPCIILGYFTLQVRELEAK